MFGSHARYGVYSAVSLCEAGVEHCDLGRVSTFATSRDSTPSRMITYSIDSR